jgi:DNA ligase-1
MENIVEKWPILYGAEKNGKVKMWSAVVCTDGDNAVAVVEFGQLDGKHQIATRVYREGKNIGKKNETTPLQQCLNETSRKWQDKKEKEEYSEVMPKAENEEKAENTKFFPMLAHTYEPFTEKKKKNDIVFPCFVQPKLDGLRCIVYRKKDNIMFQSRTGSYFDSLSHIEKGLQNLFLVYPDHILDGELYTTDMPFEELAGLIKKKKITMEDKIKLKSVCYHVYDMIDSGTFQHRHQMIDSILSSYPCEYVKKVATYEADSIATFKDFFSTFVQDGYEGIMLRNKEGLYQCGYRSHDLQKYKEFCEDEFEIVAFKEGDGRDKGTVIWVCKNQDGREFSVRPRGTIEMRKEWYNSGSESVGKKLTVIYQELSELGVPRFPVGKSVRDNF